MSTEKERDEKMDRALDALNNWYDDALKSGMGFKSDKERSDYLASLGDPEKHPMFAQNTEDMEGHPYVEALRAIKEEDKSPVELAMMYKEEGNQFTTKALTSLTGKEKTKERKKSLQEAYGRYSHALGLLDKADAARLAHTEDEKDVSEDLPRHRSILLSNRAQVSLSLENFGSCKRDCDAAITAWRGNMKAHFRKCKSLFALKDYESCVAACELALAVDSEANGNSNSTAVAEVRVLLDRSREQWAALQATHTQRVANAWTTYRSQLNDVWQLAQALGVTLGQPPLSTLAQEPLQLRSKWPSAQLVAPTTSSAVEDEGVDAIVSWPVLFLYPQANKFDILLEATLDASMLDLLQILFPGPQQRAEWDTRGEYLSASQLVVYLQLDLSPRVLNEDEWIVSGMEYALLTENASIDVMKLALREVFAKSNGCKSILGHSLNAIDQLTIEDVQTIARQRETDFQEKLQSMQVLAEKQQRLMTKFIEVPLAAPLLSVLTASQGAQLPANRCALPRGVLSVLVYPRGSAAHKAFLASTAKEFFSIDTLAL